MRNKFMFATGIENSYPTIIENGKKIRIDEMEKTGHYKCWKEDFPTGQRDGNRISTLWPATI